MTEPSHAPVTPPGGRRRTRGGDDSARMLTELVVLRGRLEAAVLPFDLPSAVLQRPVRAEMLAQLDDYVIPRLTALEAPVLAVVGGSTGAGKSTLVNSLVGRRVTAAGVLRPTTRSPVLVHHPDDGHWFGQDRLLPSLVRVSHSTDDPGSLQLVADAAVPPGLAILDAPDVDSVEERNRELAAQLLAAADLWLFVTSAARYADQVPWEFLQQASERSTAVAVVLDRTPTDAVGTVTTHLARMLAARGLKDSPLFGVAEGVVDADGVLPAGHVAEVRDWLTALAADVDVRAAVVQQTVDGAVRSLSGRAHAVADAAGEQVAVAEGARSEVEDVWDAAGPRLLAVSTSGAVVRGDVLVRWRELVGSGELLRSVEARVGWVRERVVNAVRGRPQQAERVSAAVESAAEALVLEHVEQATAAAHERWSATDVGRGLVAGSPVDLRRPDRDLRRHAEQAVRDWQREVLESVRREGSELRNAARFLAYGGHGLAVALTVVVLADGAAAGAAPGPEADAREAADLGRRLLAAMFGEEVTARLVAAAASSWQHRLLALLHGERDRYLSLVDRLEVRSGAGEQLREAVRRVDDLRFAAARRKDPGGPL